MFENAGTADLEFLSREELQELQDDLVRKHLRYVEERSPFYRRLFADHGIGAGTVKQGVDLAALPFTTKRDLEERQRDLLCTAESEIVDLCLTSGTAGKPVALLQTREDLERLGYNEDISFRAAGIGREDRVLIAAAIDRCFMAGLAYFLGLTRIGATVIRGGSSSLLMVKEMVYRHRPTAMVGVPTLLLAVAAALKDDGHDPARIGVDRVICIGEPVRSPDLSLSALGRRLGECWGAQVFGTYASTEMATAFTDCPEGRGGHLHPDLIVIEIIDEAGKVLPPGERGEVVATPLQVTGMPLVRFRTGDIATLHCEPCPCGRNSLRLGPVVGRKSQMLKYRGTTVYPPAIFAVLEEVTPVQGYYIEVHDEYELSDRIRVVVGTEDPTVRAEAIAERIAASIRVKPEVVITTPGEVARRTVRADRRKPATFFDYRQRRGE